MRAAHFLELLHFVDGIVVQARFAEVELVLALTHIERVIIFYELFTAYLALHQFLQFSDTRFNDAPDSR